jgi:signal transduction histidine kinase
MMACEDGASIEILLISDDEQRGKAVGQLTQLILPKASIVPIDVNAIMEREIPHADAALVDCGSSRAVQDSVRFLRARGFSGGIVVLALAVDPALQAMAHSLGAVCITRNKVGESPVELGDALIAALAEGSPATAEVGHARRIFATGQATLSLQHSINNPLAALLAEAQLLQLEELTSEQRQAVDRMIDLCRRIVTLVRRLDALVAG